MKERPILIAVIGYMIGILWGLYFRHSIVLFYILIIAIYYILKTFFNTQKKRKFKLLSWHRYSRYLKLLINKKAILILIMLSIFSNGNVLKLNNQYENTYQEGEKIQVIAIVIGSKIEKQYYDLYQVKLLNFKHFNLYIQVKKNSKTLEYGDKVQLQGEYKKPLEQRNGGGYDDKQYLKTLKIIGRMKINQVEILKKDQLNPILQLANEIRGKIIQKIEKNFTEENSAILKGLLLGETSDIQEEVREDFQIANISHVLAISGMHIGYIVMGIDLFLKKILGKRKANVITIIILIFYAFITGFSPSIVRAVSMNIMVIISKLIHRKSDILNSIAISLLAILIYNPFLILNVGLQLSYLGTIGIILFHSDILKILDKIKLKKERQIIEKIKETIAISLSAQIAILPILLYHFNTIGIYFLITNLLVSLVIGSIIILGFLSLFFSVFSIPVKVGITYLILVSKFNQLPFSKIYLPTPSVISIIFYFVCIYGIRQICKIYCLNYLTTTQKRVKNLIELFRYRFFQKKKRYITYIIVFFIIVMALTLLPKSLRIHFIDVGQGDCTFMITPKNKTILIDGGGSLTDEFDVGKRTLLPYLLDKGYTKIDSILISHFDQDHVRSDY